MPAGQPPALGRMWPGPQERSWDPPPKTLLPILHTGQVGSWVTDDARLGTRPGQPLCSAVQASLSCGLFLRMTLLEGAVLHRKALWRFPFSDFLQGRQIQYFRIIMLVLS